MFINTTKERGCSSLPQHTSHNKTRGKKSTPQRNFGVKKKKNQKFLFRSISEKKKKKIIIKTKTTKKKNQKRPKQTQTPPPHLKYKGLDLILVGISSLKGA